LQIGGIFQNLIARLLSIVAYPAHVEHICDSLLTVKNVTICFPVMIPFNILTHVTPRILVDFIRQLALHSHDEFRAIF
jgi:hypothetical protein